MVVLKQSIVVKYCNKVAKAGLYSQFCRYDRLFQVCTIIHVEFCKSLLSMLAVIVVTVLQIFYYWYKEYIQITVFSL